MKFFPVISVQVYQAAAQRLPSFPNRMRESSCFGLHSTDSLGPRLWNESQLSFHKLKHLLNRTPLRISRACNQRHDPRIHYPNEAKRLTPPQGFLGQLGVSTDITEVCFNH